MKDKNGTELDALDLREWIDYGISQGWIGEPNCLFHESMPLTPDEEAEMDEGGDPCISVIRVWNV